MTQIFKDIVLCRAMELDAFKESVNIDEYLENSGFKCVKTTWKIKWYINHKRGEKTASLAVYWRKKPQDFYDYGEGRGGSIIDLLMWLEGLCYLDVIKKLRKMVFPDMKMGNE